MDQDTIYKYLGLFVVSLFVIFLVFQFYFFQQCFNEIVFIAQ